MKKKMKAGFFSDNTIIDKDAVVDKIEKSLEFKKFVKAREDEKARERAQEEALKKTELSQQKEEEMALLSLENKRLKALVDRISQVVNENVINMPNAFPAEEASIFRAILNEIKIKQGEKSLSQRDRAVYMLGIISAIAVEGKLDDYYYRKFIKNGSQPKKYTQISQEFKDALLDVLEEYQEKYGVVFTPTFMRKKGR